MGNRWKHARDIAHDKWFVIRTVCTIYNAPGKRRCREGPLVRNQLGFWGPEEVAAAFGSYDGEVESESRRVAINQIEIQKTAL